METLIEKFKVSENLTFFIKNSDSAETAGIKREDSKDILKNYKKELKELQEKLYVSRNFSVLLIFQAMDAAGKDSAIEHVMSGVNPQGCRVDSFKQPTSQELRHDFLWRHSLTAPERGIIGIHNRSHYESVLVCKVHPELILAEQIGTFSTLEDLDDNFWEGRYESIRNFEKHLADNGTIILKFFLNVSKEEQKKRFLKRIDDPGKNWKFSSGDLVERKHWDEYMKVYEEAIQKTSSPYAPWFIIPADKKWFTRIAIIDIIVETLKKLPLQKPKLNSEESEELKRCREQLVQESE